MNKSLLSCLVAAVSAFTLAGAANAVPAVGANKVALQETAKSGSAETVTYRSYRRNGRRHYRGRNYRRGYGYDNGYYGYGSPGLYLNFGNSRRYGNNRYNRYGNYNRGNRRYRQTTSITTTI